MNIREIEDAAWRLKDGELARLWLAHMRGYMLLPPEPADDLVRVYTALCLLERRPALFLKASPPSGVARIIVGVHAPQLLPGLIETAVEAGVTISRVLAINGIFTCDVNVDRAATVAVLLGSVTFERRTKRRAVADTMTDLWLRWMPTRRRRSRRGSDEIQ